MDLQQKLNKFAEDLKNKRLNLWQQAQILHEIKPSRYGCKCTLTDIARHIKRSRKWVHHRLILLSLPDEVKNAANKGLFNVADLEVIASLPKDKRQNASLRILKDKAAGKNPTTDDLKHKTTRQSVKKIQNLLRFMLKHGVEGLPPRLLAWCLGRIPDSEIHAELKDSLGDCKDDDPDLPFSGRD